MNHQRKSQTRRRFKDEGSNRQGPNCRESEGSSVQTQPISLRRVKQCLKEGRFTYIIDIDGERNMKYVVDISPELAEEMNRQIKSGKYRTPQDFMLAAIQNQAYLETIDGNSTVTVSSGERSEAPPSHFSPIVSKALGARLLLPVDAARVKTVPVGTTDRSTYLWGQYNRLFPVKIVVRVATNLANEHGSDYMPLAELYEKSSDIARELGRYIQRKDKLMGRKRGAIISAGLPVGRRVDKSVARFKNQFVGYLGKDWLEGAAPTLKFIDITRNDKNIALVGITDFGLKFSTLSNPLIDRDDYAAPFSDQEVDFLLDHIATELTGEAKMIQLIFSSVKGGNATPDDLSGTMKSYNQKWTANEIVSMRVGVVSRMSEMGLLSRRKDGVRVTYELTNRGENYLSRLTATGA